MRHHLAGRLADFKAAGKLILGICNGFQVIIKSGILLDDEPPHGPPATLTYNDSGKYEDRWVRLGVASEKCVFLRGIERMYLPVAHGEGKFIARDAAALARLEAAGQLALRYVPLRRQERKRGGASSTESAAQYSGRGQVLDGTQSRSPATADRSPPSALPRQPQRLDGRRGRRLRRDRPGAGPDAAPRAASRSHASSPLDPRRGRPGGRRPASVHQRGTSISGNSGSFRIDLAAVSAREPAGAEGGLKIVAADRTIEVEDFAGEEQARHEAAFHRVRIDLGQGDSARGDLRLVEAQRAADGNLKLLEPRNEPLPLRRETSAARS